MQKKVLCKLLGSVKGWQGTSPPHFHTHILGSPHHVRAIARSPIIHLEGSTT